MKTFSRFCSKGLLILTLISGLSGCGSSDTASSGTSDTPHYITYKTSDFQIDAPEEWDTINQFDGKDFPEGIRVAFRNNLKNEGDFVANLTVVREDNFKQMTSFDVTQDKLAEHQRHLLDYGLISQEELTLRVGGADSNTMLNTFKGKNASSGKDLDFMQMALAKGNRAWVVTATLDPQEDEFVKDRLLTMIKSFQVK